VTRCILLDSVTSALEPTGGREMANTIDSIAATDAAVLIRGESGVGKGVLARKIHARSPRSPHPFVTVNCAALPDSLIESELFGHEPGSFTGACALRIGKFEQAHLGTLMLDEVGDLQPALQSKLLHVLQDGSFNRVGGNATCDADVRIVAATNCDLEGMVARSAFRADLYYRLRVVELVIPPLRERPEDIMTLAAFFARTYAVRYHRPAPILSPAFQQRLRRYHWPGNVRELENVIQALVVLQDESLVRFGPDAVPVSQNGCSSATKPHRDAIAATHAPERRNGDGPVPNDTSPGPSDLELVTPASLPLVARKAVVEVEHTLILSTLDRVCWNRRRAARLLGVSYRTLLNKMREHHIPGDVADV
jgi:transcriptional regulator with GAF, ATPase, and Fis domain